MPWLSTNVAVSLTCDICPAGLVLCPQAHSSLFLPTQRGQPNVGFHIDQRLLLLMSNTENTGYYWICVLFLAPFR